MLWTFFFFIASPSWTIAQLLVQTQVCGDPVDNTAKRISDHVAITLSISKIAPVTSPASRKIEHRIFEHPSFAKWMEKICTDIPLKQMAAVDAHRAFKTAINEASCQTRNELITKYEDNEFGLMLLRSIGRAIACLDNALLEQLRAHHQLASDLTHKDANSTQFRITDPSYFAELQRSAHHNVFNKDRSLLMQQIKETEHATHKMKSAAAWATSTGAPRFGIAHRGAWS